MTDNHIKFCSNANSKNINIFKSTLNFLSFSFLIRRRVKIHKINANTVLVKLYRNFFLFFLTNFFFYDTIVVRARGTRVAEGSSAHPDIQKVRKQERKKKRQKWSIKYSKNKL